MAGSSAREEILRRIRRALTVESNPVPTSIGLNVSSDLASRSAIEVEQDCQRNRAALIEQFESELTKVGGSFRRAVDAQSALEYIEEIAAARRATTIIGWSDRLLNGIDLRERLEKKDLEFVTEVTDPEFVTNAAAAGIGVSGVDYALADTGTLVLLTGRGRARSISLLPAVHIALIRPEQIISGLDDLFTLLREKRGLASGALSSAITFITGPSRTADIELTLVVGVHGPQELHAVLLSEAMIA